MPRPSFKRIPSSSRASPKRGKEPVEHLIHIDRDRPQAAKCRYTDWIRLARWVLRHHWLKTATCLDPVNPDMYNITKEVDLPYAAHKSTSLRRRGERLAAVTLDTLINEALAIADNATRDIKSAKRKIQARKLRILTPTKKLPERPRPSRFATILENRRSNCAKFAFMNSAH